MWCLMMYNDIINLIDYWHNIDYTSYNLSPNKRINNTFNVEIDHKLTAQYVHYFQDTRFSTPTKMLDKFNEMRHVGYANMKDYVIKKYLSRVNRMRGIPVFLIHLNRNTWQCDINESNINNIIGKCAEKNFPILVFGKANLIKYKYLFHVNIDFTYPYEIKNFVNSNLPDTIKLLTLNY